MYFISSLILFGIFINSCFSQTTYLSFGNNIPPAVKKRCEELIRRSSQYEVKIHNSDDPLPTLFNSSIFLTFGSSFVSNQIIPQQELEKLGDEGYIIRSQMSNDSIIIAANGNEHHVQKYSFNSSIGAAYATYQTLELLGFAFLRPLLPHIPLQLKMPENMIDIIEKPRWLHRGWHIHTQHPLELTDFLQGMSIETDGYSESWESMMPDWELTLEWLIANLQNEVEWILLWADSWSEFAYSQLRKDRIRSITDTCHSFGIPCGIDEAIALVQQHTWRMITEIDREDQERNFEQIRDHLDWWADAGLDFVSTENGFSEFSSGSCTKMLELINEATRYADEVHQMTMVIKVHISTGQICEEFTDPITGEPLNFNFLPIYADPRLGIMAHTVQFYALDDPAPTYGNDNFTFMFDFMFQQAGGERKVIYYPETAYWVNFDNQVPLFLPLYALNRMRDLRLIADREKKESKKIDGHCVFDSGWEWGYWIQDVVVARGSWNPLDEFSSDEKALSFALSPITKLFGAYQSEITDLIIELAVVQKELLIYGKVEESNIPSEIEKRNGIAYLEGWDTWSEIGSTFESFLNTQPRRLGLNEFRTRLTTDPDYEKEVEPLLAEMSKKFKILSDQFTSFLDLIPEEGLPILSEIVDGVQILSNRATQIHALYDYASSWKRGETAWRKERFAVALGELESATEVVRRREKSYATPLERIAGWRKNPTVYVHTYLWNVKTLYYFWRDHDKAEHKSRDVMSPCYMNFINPIDVAIGEGLLFNLSIALRKWADQNDPGGNHFILDCAAAPLTEPTYPLDQTLKMDFDVVEMRDDNNNSNNN